MTSPTTSLGDEYEPDPLFVDSLREAGWILLMWVACFIWTLAACLTQGYPDPGSITPETFPTVFGIPAWVAYGIALPWLAADIVTIWFCIFKMKDADLGTEPDEQDAAKGNSSPSTSEGVA